MSKLFELRWRDLDHLGHVYQAVYATLFDEARAHWMSGRLPDFTGEEYVLVRIEIDYRAELRIGDGPVTVAVEAEELGRKSVTTREQLTAASGFVAAEARSTLVMWDATTRRSRELTDAERAALSATGAPS